MNRRHFVVAGAVALAPRLAGAGRYVRYADGQGFEAVLAQDAPKIQKVVAFSNVQPE